MLQSKFFMKKNYLFLFLTLLYAFNSGAQTVTATPVLSTVCASNSTQITATTSPVGYVQTAITHDPIPSPGPGATTILAEAGVFGITASSGINLDDCRWDNIALPFTFNFYGIDYTNINISSNGWIALGTTNTVTTGFNVSLANVAAPNAVIHAITSDLDLRTATGGTLEYFEDGSFPNRVFVILFTDVKFLTPATGTATVEVILRENSNQVEIHTTNCTNTSKPKAQGIENSAGTAAMVATNRNNTTTWTAMPNAFRYTPDQFTYAWTGAGLSSTTGKTVTVTPTVTTTYNVTSTRVSDNATATGGVTITVDPASNTLANTPVAGGSSIGQNISVAAGGTYYRNGNCNLIARIVPSGANPVNNSIQTSVRVDTGATKRGTTNLYAARIYDIEPIFNPAIATATITLYYLQSEFNKYNLRATDSMQLLLPTGPSDVTGISNLMIKQFHGTGTAPGAYSAGTLDSFTTATAGVTVIYNSTYSRWEVTVPVVGFSGFYLTSKKTGVVPIKLEYFKGSRIGNNNVLDWKVNCTSTEAKFEIERSNDSRNFSSIGSFTASQLRCLQAFDYTDNRTLSGMNYYRLKMIDVDGKASYSNIVALLNKETGFELVSMSPNLIHKETAKLNITAAQKTDVTIIVTDIAGKRVQAQTTVLTAGNNVILMDFEKLSAGTYQVTGYTVTGKSKTIRFVKQ